MTPEEKAVIEAAREMYEHESPDGAYACGVIVAVGHLLKSEEPKIEPIWAEAEFRWVLAGDRVRLNGQEATVESSFEGGWNAAIESRQMESGRWWDKLTPWRHSEVKVRLAGRPVPLVFAASLPVEILCDAERAAILVLQRERNAIDDGWTQDAREWNRAALAADGQPATFKAHLAAAQRTGAQGRGSLWSRPGAQ